MVRHSGTSGPASRQPPANHAKGGEAWCADGCGLCSRPPMDVTSAGRFTGYATALRGWPGRCLRGLWQNFCTPLGKCSRLRAASSACGESGAPAGAGTAVAVWRGRGAARIRQPLDLPTMTQASPGHDATRQETQGAQGASAAAGQDGGQPVQDRVWTIPNALSVLRLLGVPLFLWLILQPVFHGPHYDGWALLVLALSGATDYLDGKIARAFGQVSRIGQLLDPAADRLYILSTLA